MARLTLTGMDVVAEQKVIESIQERGGALYVWPRKARCCGGTVQLDASTERPDKAFRRVNVPSGRIRAFWDGLAWIP